MEDIVAIFFDLFNDWVGILSLLTVLFIIAMSIYFAFLFHGDIDEEGHLTHSDTSEKKDK